MSTDVSGEGKKRQTSCLVSLNVFVLHSLSCEDECGC